MATGDSNFTNVVVSGTLNAGGIGITFLQGTATWNPGSIADGDEEAKDITVTGAVLGDLVLCSHSTDVLDGVLRGAVTAADTVTVVLANNTGGAIDVTSGTTKALVIQTS